MITTTKKLNMVMIQSWKYMDDIIYKQKKGIRANGFELANETVMKNGNELENNNDTKNENNKPKRDWRVWKWS